MKAIVINEPGGPDKLIHTEVPTPKIKEGWTLVKVMGFGINHSEIFTRQGLSPTVEFPRILGIECVGVIEETTDEDRLPINQKVISLMGSMGRMFDGGYAEYVLLPNEQIYPVDTKLDWKTLATIPETYYTAFGSMKNLQINSEDKILVRGATSGVGVSFINLVKAKYPKIIMDGSTRNLNKEDLLKDIGFDSIIKDKNNILQTDKSYNKVIDLIGPATIKNTFDHIEEKGIVCSTGQLGGQWVLEDFDPIIEIKKNSYLTSFHSEDVNEEKVSELLEYIEKYLVQIKPEKIYDLKDTPKAHEYIESEDSFGKVIVLNQENISEYID